MPIEIRELVIRATVDPHSVGTGIGSCGTGSGADAGRRGGASSASAGAAGGARADGDLVQTCVREVIRILEAKRER
jgi:hypothetical protein